MPRNLATTSTIAGPTVGITREMVYARTREMAVQAGRAPLQIRQRDYELARAELTGETDMECQEAVLDSLFPHTSCKKPRNPSPSALN